MANTSQNNKRLVKNSLLLYIRMLLTMGISLYTSRVVLKTLGFEDFGIYNVVGGFVSLFSFINNSMTAATQRFMTIELGKNKDISRVFTTSMWIHLIIAIGIVILCESIGLWFLFNKMNIPEERLFAAICVLQCAIISTVVMFVSVPYNAIIIAHERMSAFAYISLLEVGLKLTIVYVVLFQNYDNLIAYAVLMLVVQLIIRFCYNSYCKRNFHGIRFSFTLDKQLFCDMFKFASWTMSGNLAMIGYTQGLNVLLNLFFNPVVNAARGIAVQVQNAVIAFCTNFIVAVKPQITKSYAQNDLERMHELVIAASKYSFYMMLCVSLPLMFCVNYILKIWLGNVPDNTNIFLVIILLSSIVRTLADPIITSIHATGNIKAFQLIESLLLLCILPASYILLLLGYPPYSVFFVHLFFEVATQVARIAIVLPKIALSNSEYVKNAIWPILKVLIVSPILPLAYLYIGNPVNNIIMFGIAVLSSLSTIFILGLKQYERQFLYEQYHSLICRIWKK